MTNTDKLTAAEIGKFGEDIAVKHLREKGYRILERNFRYSHRELDIIAENDQWIAFVEVKARTDNGYNLQRYGNPGRAVTLQKQKFIISAANHYIKTHHPGKWPRLDVIEVYLAPQLYHGKPIVKKIRHMEGAFRAR